jgi:hypothetical protein
MSPRNPAPAKSTAERRESAVTAERRSDRPLRRQRTAQAEKDVARGLKDTERRGTPNDLPKRGR